MAILKTINRKGKYHDRNAFKDVISYILNDSKVPNRYYVLRNILDSKTAADEMLGVFHVHQKKSVRLYHMILSFSEQDLLSAREAYGIAYEISDYFADRYQFIAGVHEDSEHVHIHFAWNAVSFQDGKKYHSTPEEFYRLVSYIRDLIQDTYLDIDVLVSNATKRKKSTS